MITIKLYVPLHDNDGNNRPHQHISLMNNLADYEHISGFTTYDAIGHWFNDGVHFKDSQRIYEFHVDGESGYYLDVEYFLMQQAKIMCKSLKQECIYMTIDNEQHFITEDK